MNKSSTQTKTISKMSKKRKMTVIPKNNNNNIYQTIKEQVIKENINLHIRKINWMKIITFILAMLLTR